MRQNTVTRNRFCALLCVFVVIALGLASREFPAMFPEILGKYPGDALWALMIFVGLAVLFPRATTYKLAIFAFAFSCAVELSQLYQAPWLNEVRHTTLGHLVLGSAFSWLDIAAYFVGVLIGALIDLLYIATARFQASKRDHRLPI